jgi:hypothetical protein
VFEAALAGTTLAQQGGNEDQAKPQNAPQIQLPSPKDVPTSKLLPDLPAVKVRRGGQRFNVHMVDTTPLTHDKNGIWVLEFSFKPLRMLTVDVPGKGRKKIHYLYYKVVNRTGKPRNFLPQFTLVTDTGKSYDESVLPRGVPIVQAREEPDYKLLGTVDMAGVIPVSDKEGHDEAVFGVAMWDGVDPHADKMSVFVRGLSDGYTDVSTPDGKQITRYKTLRIDLIRRGDARNLNESEIRLAEPPYEWIYR